MQGPKVKAQKIPKRKREQLAAPLLEIVRKAFEDPQIIKEYEVWLENRRKKLENQIISNA